MAEVTIGEECKSWDGDYKNCRWSEINTGAKKGACRGKVLLPFSKIHVGSRAQRVGQIGSCASQVFIQSPLGPNWKFD